MRAKLALLGMTVGVALAVGVSCADKPPVGLIVAIQTNLSVTKDFDQLGLYITADGVPILTQTYAIEGGNVRLPSTIAIAPPKNENAVIRVRAVAFKSDAAKVLREGITTVPTTRLAVMPLPLKWLDSGSGKGNEAEWQVNPFASARSICPDLQTQKDGICTTSTFAVDALPTYVASEIFGGGDEDGTGSSCFDVGACFGSRTAAAVDETACTVVAPAGATNVAVATTNGDGEPVGGENLIVLDEGDYTKTGGVISLPKTLCNPSGMKPQRKAIYLSGTCETKKAKYGVCGPHSVGKPLPPLGDAGSLDGGPVGDAGVVERLGATEPQVATLALSGTHVYATGADPSDGGPQSFRLFGYAKTGGTFVSGTSFSLLSGANVASAGSTALAFGRSATQVDELYLVRQESPAIAEVDLFTVDTSGALLHADGGGSMSAILSSPVIALSPLHVYLATQGGATDAGLGHSVVQYGRDLSEGPPVAPIFGSAVTSLSFVSQLPSEAGVGDWVYFTTGTQAWRIGAPDASPFPEQVFDFAPSLARSHVVAGGKLVVYTSLSGGFGEIWAADQAIKGNFKSLASGFKATELVTTAGTRYRGLASDGKYVYFATDSGISYVALDGSTKTPVSLVTEVGVYSVATDAKYLYWTATANGNQVPSFAGISRTPLVP